MERNDLMSDGQKSKKDDSDEEVERDGDAWMDTLSDLIFLMITFFVLLITMSSMDQKAVKDAFGLFDEASGVLKFPDPKHGEESFVQVMTPLGEIQNKAKKVDEKPIERNVATDNAQRFIKGVRDGLMNEKARDDLYATLTPLTEKVAEEIQIIRIKEGVEVIVSGRLLFPHGSTQLDDKGRALLQDVAVVLQLWGGDIKVIAMWPWFYGPEILTQIVGELQSRRVNGKKMKPELFNDMQRKVRFVLRKGEDNGQ